MDISRGDVEQVDVVVLGIGPGWRVRRRKLAEAGLDVVGVEKALVGGECPFWGCTPSKLMVRAADLLAEAAGIDGMPGTAPGPARTGRRWPRGSARANHDWDDHHARRAARGGGRRGRPRARPARRRRAGSTSRPATEPCFEARAGVVLNTGTEPAPAADRRAGRDAVLDQPGGDEGHRAARRRWWCSAAGPSGSSSPRCSPGSAATVTLLESDGPADAPGGARGEPGAGEVFADEGIEVRTGRRGRRASSTTTAASRSTLDDGVGVGRPAAGRHRPRATNLADVGLETVGLDPTATRVEPTTGCGPAERLWAVGDITGKGAFTHVSRYQAAIAVRDILGERRPPRPTTARCPGSPSPTRRSPRSG